MQRITNATFLVTSAVTGDKLILLGFKAHCALINLWLCHENLLSIQRHTI